MKILTIRESSPIVVEEITIRRAKITFDENVEMYRWDPKEGKNVLGTDNFVVLPVHVLNAILFSGHDKAGEICAGLVAADVAVWFNMACEGADIELEITNDDEKHISNIQGKKLVFSTDELQQMILKMGIYYNRGLRDKAKELKKKIEELLMKDIDDVI